MNRDNLVLVAMIIMGAGFLASFFTGGWFTSGKDENVQKEAKRGVGGLAVFIICAIIGAAIFTYAQTLPHA